MSIAQGLVVPTLDPVVRWDLRDEFPVDAGSLGGTFAPSPGPGGWTTFQTGGSLSLNGGEAVIPAPGAPAWGAVGFYETAQFARVAGMAGIMAVRPIGSWANVLFGFTGNSSLAFTFDEGAFYIQGAGLVTPQNATVTAEVGRANTSPSVLTEFASVLMGGAGSYMFQKIAGAWTMLWHTPFGAGANLRLGFTNNNSGYRVAHARRRQLGGAFASNYGIALQNVASPVHLTEYDTSADQITRLTLTAPGSLGAVSGFRYRVVDSNNHFYVYFDAAGALRVDSVVAGVATSLLNVAGVISASAVRHIQIIVDGNEHVVYTSAASGSHTRRGSFTSALFPTASRVVPVIGAGWTAANLRSWARRSPLYGVLNAR